MQNKQSKKIGQQFEAFTAEYLYRAGLELLAKNFVVKGGEVDLIMLDIHTQTYVFIEVKYRKNSAFGSAEETLTSFQQQRVIYAANSWLIKHHLNPTHTAIRFDLFAITGSTTGKQFKWIKNAF